MISPQLITPLHSDIIDTEPSTGDVYKMLLGSFVEEYDEADEESEAVAIGQTESTSDWLRSRGSPARSSSYQTFPVSEQASENGIPTIDPPIPPTRPTTLDRRYPSS